MRVDEANKSRVRAEYDMAMQRPVSSEDDDRYNDATHTRPALHHGNSFESKFKKLSSTSQPNFLKEPEHPPPSTSSTSQVRNVAGSVLHAAASLQHMLPHAHSHHDLKHFSSLKAVKEESDIDSPKKRHSDTDSFESLNDKHALFGKRMIKRSISSELPPLSQTESLQHAQSMSAMHFAPSSAFKQDLLTAKFHLQRLPTSESLTRRSKAPHILIHLQYLKHGQRAALFFAPTKTVQHTHEIWEVYLRSCCVCCSHPFFLLCCTSFLTHTNNSCVCF
jgi:hypothetical protein